MRYHAEVRLTLPWSLPDPPRRTGGRATLVLVVTLAVTLAAGLAYARPARAETTTFEGLSAPIVRVNLHAGDVTIRTWDRQSVEVTGEATLSIVHRTMHQVPEQTAILIPQAHSGPATLAPETFVISSIAPGTHDAVVVKSMPDTPAGPVVVTVPNDAALVFVFARGGNLDVHDYRGGTFVGFTSRGRLALQHVGGTIFAQTGRGALVVDDATTDRLRARTLSGNIAFERCRSHQIEATSIDGSIVYDEGSFEPGLARFESTHGDVAIGTISAVEFGAHVAGEGRVFTQFERGARTSGTQGDANAVVGGGGPVVTAATQTGNVYLFDGTLRTRERLGAAWQRPLAMLQRSSGFHRESGPHDLSPIRAFPQPLVPDVDPTPVVAPHARPRHRHDALSAHRIGQQHVSHDRH